MKKYNFDEVIDRKGTGSIKWEKAFQSDAKQHYPLWVADMDFACSDAIIEALHKRSDERIFGYHTGFDKFYRKAVCSWFKRRFDWKIDPSTIVYAGGVVNAIAYLIEILSEEGDGIIIQPPVYHPFRKHIEVAKRKVVHNALINTNGYYTMDYVSLIALMARDDVKGMILCSPHNPGGRVWKEEELLKVVAIAKTYHKWMIVDEIHCDIVRNGVQHIPLLSIAQDYANEIIACTAPSKSFNLAGLQISNIVIQNKEYRERWKAFVEDRLSLGSANSFAISATKAAYNDSEEWLRQVNAYIDENMRWAKAFIEEHLRKAIVSPLEGTYLLWVDLRSYCDDDIYVEECLHKAGIICNRGSMFGDEGKGFIRINVACTKALMMDCLKLLVSCVQELASCE